MHMCVCIVGGGVQLGPLGTTATNRPIVPAPGDYDYGEIGGMFAQFDWFFRSFLFWKKNNYMYKNGLGNAHPALCSTFL
jgi:hypothetical protein